MMTYRRTTDERLVGYAKDRGTKMLVARRKINIIPGIIKRGISELF